MKGEVEKKTSPWHKTQTTERNRVNSTIQGRRSGACFSKVTIINWPEMLLLFDTKCDDEF